jgi:hypothetical protein
LPSGQGNTDLRFIGLAGRQGAGDRLFDRRAVVGMQGAQKPRVVDGLGFRKAKQGATSAGRPEPILREVPGPHPQIRRDTGQLHAAFAFPQLAGKPRGGQHIRVQFAGHRHEHREIDPADHIGGIQNPHLHQHGTDGFSPVLLPDAFSG